MATDYKRPGVYIDEISKFHPSVAQVETAIPAFVGYTDKAVIDGVDYHSEEYIRPVRIKSMPEYEYYFGYAPDPTDIEIELNADNSVKRTYVNGINLLYDSVRMFYANGGGDCFIVSVGKHNEKKEDVDKDELIKGLLSLEKEDHPTLLVIPESVNLSAANAGEVHVAMLAQSNKLQDCFALLDIVNGDKEITPSSNPVAVFRNYVGMNNLKYGAAYYPWIKTTLSFKLDYNAISEGKYTKEGGAITDIKTLFNSEITKNISDINNDIESVSSLSMSLPALSSVCSRTEIVAIANDMLGYAKSFFSLSLKDNNANDASSSLNTHIKTIAANSNFHSLLNVLYDYIYFSKSENSNATTSWAILSDLTEFDSFTTLAFANPTDHNNDIYVSPSTAVNAAPYFYALADKLKMAVTNFKNELIAIRQKRTDTLKEVDPVYRGIYEAIKAQGVVLPPSGAVAGVYAMVDETRGVWKAPANISKTAVKGPAVHITNENQEELNVDIDAGKSVNAIRAFTGMGTLIWGARTLAGNDNEWRYIPVRRFFNMVEESVKKATSQFVFEANDANTWGRVRAMIENFLVLQWKAGALAGAKQEHAFFVRVGLGQTMTAQDILNGYMNVEIGLAVVRPAEFIILKFSHKMQES